MGKLATVKDVPLLKVGTWDASTGKASVTEEDLQEILDAYSSGEVDLPVIKIGHLDPRFIDPAQDGEPAYGQVSNLRTIDDGKTLVGDYINVPEELAGKLVSAYPNRSVEFFRGVKLKDAAGKVLKTFKVVLTAVALLGATMPAVMGLGDVHTEFKAADTDGAFALSAHQFGFPGGLTGNALREALDGALQAALKDAAGGDVPEWGFEVWVMDYDDASIWYRNGGVIYERGYTITDGAVTLADTVTPVAEERTFKPIGAPEAAPAGAPGADTGAVPPATAASAEPTNDSTPRGDNSNRTKDTPTVDIIAKLRELFGLPADADDQTILDAVTAAKTAEDAATAAAAAGAEGGEGGTAASGAVEPTDSVTVSAVAFSSLQDTVQKLAARNEALEKAATEKRRDEIIATALSEGRLTAPETASWRSALDSSEDTTVALLAARTPVFSTVELGHASSFNAAGEAHAEALTAAEDRIFGIC